MADLSEIGDSTKLLQIFPLITILRIEQILECILKDKIWLRADNREVFPLCW